MTDETIRFQREGRRKRKHMMMSADLILVVKRLAEAEGESESSVVERAVWADLVDRYGRERVLELVGDVQEEIDQDDRLESPVAVEIDQ